MSTNKLYQVKEVPFDDLSHRDCTELTFTETEFLNKYLSWLTADMLTAMDGGESFSFEINIYSRYTIVQVRLFDEKKWNREFALSEVNEGAD